MSRRAKNPFKVPNRLRRLGIQFVEEAAAVVLVEDAGEAPGRVLQRLHVLDLDEQDVARLGGFDFEGPGEVVDAG